MKRKITTKLVEEEMYKIYGDRFKLLSPGYVSYKTKLILCCKTHGTFEKHYQCFITNSSGCPKCNGVFKKDDADYINKAKEVHKDFYLYDNVFGVKPKKNIEIICPIHGIFSTREDSHLSGIGCPECSKLKYRESVGKNFLEKAYKTHHNKYKYPEFNYQSAHKKIKVSCPIHGEFYQTPSNHLAGKGCIKCAYESQCGWVGASSLYETDRQSFIYVVNLYNEKEDFIKVGVSVSPKTRLRIISKKYNIQELKFTDGPAYKIKVVENKILYRAGLEKYRPKIRFAGYTECFTKTNLERILQVIEEEDLSYDK